MARTPTIRYVRETCYFNYPRTSFKVLKIVKKVVREVVADFELEAHPPDQQRPGRQMRLKIAERDVAGARIAERTGPDAALHRTRGQPAIARRDAPVNASWSAVSGSSPLPMASSNSGSLSYISMSRC